jgi:mycofactocin system FadH/OYE family oxidoreductase 1
LVRRRSEPDVRLLEPLPLARRTAPNRLLFGPHETNLARRRAISDRHVAYYRRRALGGAGIIVVEEASVHESDWPYERSPLAADSAQGWDAVAHAVHPHGALVFAAIGHSGGQGSSAYSQTPLWAPSRVPEVNSREVPKSMEQHDVASVVAGFGAAAEMAMGAGLDGVEVNAGQHSLVRQFLSGLTNQRTDEWGQDKLAFATAVLQRVRRAIGSDGVLGLRLSCDELAPWAGLVPEAAAGIAVALAPLVDYITVVRGSIFTASATRPDGHVAPGFNLDLVGLLRRELPSEVAVVAQGSIVDADQAEWALGEGICDAVEMTRAQIADPDLGAKLTRGQGARVRPCILCNQACQVRDARNPIVSCVVEPSSGHEWEDPRVDGVASVPSQVLVVGAGVAGLECARVAAARGHDVRLVESRQAIGGAVVAAASGAGRDRLALVARWLEDECRTLGVAIETGCEIGADEASAFDGHVVLCTGSRPGLRDYVVADGATVLTARQVLEGQALPDGTVVVWDPIGGPIGISAAELLRQEGRDVHLLTPDLIAGNELSRSGDLVPANIRLLAAGVLIEKRSILREVQAMEVRVEDRFTGAERTIAATGVVDAGYRLPEDALWRATGEQLARAGDAVAPRSIYEAVLEGRRCAFELEVDAGVAAIAGVHQ